MMFAEIGRFGDRDVILCTPARGDFREDELLKTVPGRMWNKQVRSYLPLAWASMIALRGVYGQAFTYGPNLWAWATEQRARMDAALAMRWSTEAPLDPRDELSIKLLPFQRADVAFMRIVGSGSLNNDIGCGKTVSLLSFVRSLELDFLDADDGENHAGLDPYPVLVVCKNTLIDHWAPRVPTWLPTAKVFTVQGTLTQKRKILAEARTEPNALVIVGTSSIASLSRLASYGSIYLKKCVECDPKAGDPHVTAAKCQVHSKELNGFGFRTVLVDEAHDFGVPQSQQTRALWAVLWDPSVRWRWTATGTPDNVERLWAIMHAVSPDNVPAKTKWMDRYAEVSTNHWGRRQTLGFKRETTAEIHRILDPLTRRMIRSVVLPQLPPVLRQVRKVPMSAGQARSYNELDKELHTVLPDGQRLITASPIVSRGRQLQMCSAAVTVDKLDPDDISTWTIGMKDLGRGRSPKLDEMEAVIDDIGETVDADTGQYRPKPFLVSVVNVDLAWLAAKRLEELHIPHAVIVGGMDGYDIQRSLTMLKEGSIRAVVFGVDAGGTGLDMSGAPVMIRLQRSDSLIKVVQAENRFNRIGAEIHSSLLVVDIVTEGTVEVLQMEQLANKLREFDEINRDRAQIFARMQNVLHGSAEYERLGASMNDLTRQIEQIACDDQYLSGTLEMVG